MTSESSAHACLIHPPIALIHTDSPKTIDRRPAARRSRAGSGRAHEDEQL